jgi:hypothetical protein
VPVGGPFVVGAEVFRGDTGSFSGKSEVGGLYGLLGGVESSGDSAHASLLLRLAIGQGSPGAARLTTVSLPQAALRGEVSLLAADLLLVGLWATAGTELGQRTVANPGGPEARIGGRVFGGGLFLGFTIPRRAAAAGVGAAAMDTAPDSARMPAELR